MPQTVDELNQFEKNPKFIGLSYEDQIKYRSAFLKNKLLVDPEFINLSDKAKQAVYEKLVYRPPVFEKDRPELQNVIPMIQEKKDPQMLIGVTQMLFPQFFVGVRLDPKLRQENDNMQMLRYTYALNFVRKFNKDSVLGQGVRKIANGIWEGISDLADMTPEQVKNANDTEVRDVDKLIQYMDYNMNQDSKLRKMLPSINFLASTGAMAADLYVGYQFVTGSAQAFFKELTDGLGVGRMVLNGMKAGKKATWVQRVLTSKLAGTVAPPVFHAIGDGLVGMTREMINDSWDGSLKDVPTQERLIKGAKYFGEYAIGDLLFFTAGKLLKNMGSTAFRYIKGFDPNVKAAEEITDALKKIMKLEDLNPAWFARQDDVTKEVIRQTQAVMKTFDKVERLTPEDAFKVFSGSKGFLALPEGEGWKMLNILDDKIRGTFKNIDEAADFVIKQSKMIEGFTPGSTPQLTGKSLKGIKVEGKLRIKLPKESDKAIKVLSDTIAPVGGKFTTEGVETFTKGFLSSGGSTDDVVKGVKTALEGDKIKVFVKDELVQELPAYVKNPMSEYKAVSDLVESVNKFVPKEGQVKNAVSVYQKEVVKKGLYTPGFVEDFAQRNGAHLATLPDGTVQMRMQGKILTGNDYNDVMDQVLKEFSSNDPVMLKKYLSTYEGANLIETKKGFTLKKGKQNLGTYGSVDELLTKHPEFIPRIPSEYGPKLAFVDDSAKTLTYKQGVATGSTTDLMNELSKFKDISKTARPFKFRGNNVVSAGSEFQLTVDNLGYTETFKSLKDVDSFLKKGLYDKIEYVAPRKGFIFDTYRGQYHLTTSGGKTYVANSLDEASAILAKNGIMPDWAPELTGIDAQIVAAMDKVPGFKYKPETHMPEVSAETFMSAADVFSGYYRAPDNMFSKMLKKGVAGSDEVLKQFRKLEDVRDTIVGMTQRLAPYIDDVFTLPGGKRLGNRELKMVTAMMEMEPEGWAKFIAENKLDPGIKDVVNNLRQFYGTHADSGLFLYMGNDPTSFLKNYAPRLRKYLKTTRKNYTNAGLKELLQDAFGNNVPKGLDVFFKHARVEDVYNLTREMNAKVLLQKYVMMGHRNKFMGPVVEEMNKWIGANMGKVDSALLTRFGAYLGDVAGLPSTINVQIAEDVTQRFFSKLKIGDKLLAKNFSEVIMGTSYLATMGWRAWLPIRNSFQIWTTLAPRMGNTWVGKALKQLDLDKSGALYREMQKKGMLTAGLPVGGGQMFTGEDVVSKTLKSGLSLYKNSDSFTRAVAYMTSTSRFDDALLRLRKGLINQKQFIKHSGMFNLADDRLGQAMKLIDQGFPDAAKDLFARDMIMETMFPYRAGTSPLAFRGVIGKMFGQFGHYPVYWVENIRRGLGRGTIGNRMAYAARFLGNTTAIAGSLAAIGINSDSFLAWSPAMFTGGPWYNTLNQVLQLPGKGYEGRQARAKLLGLKQKDGKVYWDEKVLLNHLRSVIPAGVFTDKMVREGVKYFNQGDYYRFLLAVGSVPMRP